jgi:hypothetical protein
MNITKRFSIAFLFAAASIGTSALALAETPAEPSCQGHDGKAHHDGKGKGAHFKKADKNNDGFLTKDEVGEKRWTRISVADANKDAKVSQAEMQQARKDGKLGRGKPSKKA